MIMGMIITTFIFIVIMLRILDKWECISFKNLEFKRYFDKERVFVGEAVRLTTEITNNKLLILPWIEINSNIPKDIDFKDQRMIEYNNKSERIYKVITSLLSYQRIKKHNTIYCKKRGYYSFHDTRMSVGDFFGFAVAEKEIHYPMNLIVYPEVKPLSHLIIPFKSIQGEISVRRWLIPDNIAVIGAREYTSYDSFNTIDWKATARTSKLHVKKLDYTADPSLVVLLNVQTNDIYWKDVNPELIENGIDIATSMVQKSIDEKVNVGYSSNAFFYGDTRNIFIKPNNGRNQRMLIFDALAKTSYLPLDSFDMFLSKNIKLLDKNNIIILITAHISKELTKQINWMIKMRYHLKLILLDNDLNTEDLNKEVDIIYSYEFKK